MPKKANASELNDYRPVALTPVVMKSFERIVLNKLLSVVGPSLDKYQFAYKKHRGVEDATITVLNAIHEHLDKQGTYVRALMVDFSSAFNTIIPSILVAKLDTLSVPIHFCRWIWDFLTDRRQCVYVNGEYSGVTTINTGAPQGCVLSPALFTIYTNDSSSHSNKCLIVKYADDTVLIGFVTGDDESDYRQEISRFTKWCDDHNLLLNVTKTKELIFDFRRKSNVINQVCINSKGVEIVSKYKYLGTTISNDLKWGENMKIQLRKAQSRIYFLRKLKEFNVDQTIMKLFYSSVVESVAIFGILIWFRGLSCNEMKQLNRIRKTAERIIGINIEHFENVFNKRVTDKVKVIFNDISHPLHEFYNTLPSSKRFRSVSCRTKRHLDTFVPYSVMLCNEAHFLAQSPNNL